MLGTVYSRKRRGPSPEDPSSDRMFGIVFKRNREGKKRKVVSLAPQTEELRHQEHKQALGETRTEDRELSIREQVGILEGDLWVGFSGPVVLAVLVESPWSGSSNTFARFLVSVLSWMRRAGVGLSEFVAFLLSGSIVGVFAQHRIRFIPPSDWKYNVFSRGSCGHCVVYGAEQFVPLLSVDFSALPSYFKNLHLGITLRSMYLLETLTRYEGITNDSLALVVWHEQHEPHVFMETVSSGAKVEVPVTPLAVTPSMRRDEPSSGLITPEPLQRYELTWHRKKSRKNQRKRTSVRHAGVQGFSRKNQGKKTSVPNVQGAPVKKNIPVPGISEVSNYEDKAAASFVRPETYIRVKHDEVERALTSDITYYDMDSEDEEWLGHLNARFSDEESGIYSQISEENFENIIFTLEKDVYSHPDELTDEERAFVLCEKLGKRDMVAAVYDYWLKKRKKTHARLCEKLGKCGMVAPVYDYWSKKRNTKRAGGVPLVKVFLAPPLKRSQLITKAFLRKKTSFNKRQRSRSGRGKPEVVLLQAVANEEAERRVHEAESTAKNAVETAIHLRSRAQMLMGNAELAVYRSVMALRLAEALWVSESPDLASSILE